MLFFWLALDAAVFRSGLYARYLEPESTAGTTERALRATQALWRDNKKNVVVIGDSRVAEGFSSKAARQIPGNDDVNFINAGMAGTTPRVWDFFLKAADPRQDRFKAVVIMTTSFSDTTNEGDLTNRALDLNYLTPILRLRDGPLLAGSFTAPDLKQRAWRNLLLPSEPLQPDIRALLDAPIARINKAATWRHGYPQWTRDYQGHDSRDPELADLQAGHDIEQVPDTLQKKLLAYVERTKSGVDLSNQEYRANWYGRIAKRYADAGVPVLIFLMPRGPYAAELSPAPVLTGSLKALSDAGLIRVLNPDPELKLEHPNYFFDELHLNADGRLALSADLGNRVGGLLR